jgi:hypothetical protein
MVEISAATLDHEMTLGTESIENLWVLAIMEHGFQFWTLSYILQVRNNILLHLSPVIHR